MREKRSKDWPGSNDNFFKAIDGLLHQSSVIIASISTNQASTLTHTHHFHFIINNYKKVTRARALLLHQAYIIIYIIYYSSNSTNNCQCSPSMTSSGGAVRYWSTALLYLVVSSYCRQYPILVWVETPDLQQ